MSPSADPGGLEEHERLGAAPCVGPARRAFGYGMRLRSVDDVGGVNRVPHTQSDPQVDVRLDVGRDDAAGTLCGENEVDAERPSDRGDPDQSVDEGRQLLGEGLELVDHQQKARQPRISSASGGLVVLDVLGSEVLQQALAAPELGLE